MFIHMNMHPRRTGLTLDIKTRISAEIFRIRLEKYFGLGSEMFRIRFENFSDSACF